MKEKKYKNIGALELNNLKLGKGHGSGVLISRNLVLTSAHNVFNRGSREINEIKFYPGQCGELVEAHAYEVEDYFFPRSIHCKKFKLQRLCPLKAKKACHWSI